MDSIVRDIRYAVRGLLRQPEFAAVAIATIALGAAAVASVLSIVSAVLLRPAPYPTADRIVQIEQVVNGRPREEVSTVDLRALREGSPSLSHVTLAWFSETSVAGDGLPERARRVYTDWHAFALLGVPPLIGRLPTAADEQPDAEPVGIIGYGLWSERFGSDPTVVGRTIRVDGQKYTVIGVMPLGFRFPAPYWAPGDLWLFRGPSHAAWPTTRAGFTLGFALLDSGRTLTRAQAEADAVAAALAAQYPDPAGNIGLRLTTWAETLRAEARPRLLLILGASLTLFLIVCVNVANLLISRGVDRQREFAARIVLGAGRVRLVRQLLIETGVVFAAGGAAGVVIARFGSGLIASMQSLGIPRLDESTVDGTVAGMTLAITFIAAALVGVIPAWQGTRVPLTDVAASGGRRASGGPGWRRIQRSLIAIEICLAFVLVTGTGVLLEGAWRLAQVNPGFDANELLRSRITLPPERYSTVPEQLSFYGRLLSALGEGSGVIAAGVVDVPPGLGGRSSPSVLVDGDPEPRSVRDLRRADLRLVSSGYLETLGLKPQAGRLFSDADSSQPVAIVNETFARQHLGGREAIGQRVRVRLGGGDLANLSSLTVVGVVPDLLEKTLYEPPPATVYVPMGQATASRTALLRMNLLVRSLPTGDAATVMRRAVANADATLAPSGVTAMQDLLAAELSLNHVSLTLLSVLASAALSLAVIGVYGVTSHAVRLRAREIAIRIALGASPQNIRTRVLGENSLLVIAGLTGGVIIATWTTALLRAVVLGIHHTSAATYAGAALVLTASVVLGCYLPARRASQADPAKALRGE